MFTYLKMKKNEWKVKAFLYGSVAALLDNQKDVLEWIQKLYIALKDVPADELQREFVTRLTETIHEEKKDN
ncbi:MAG: hypothetical protein K1W26_19370 [Acetatifactor sp.]